MTNKEKAKEIVKETEDFFYHNEQERGLACALKMAEWKDSQPQIIEIFGKRVKLVNDDGKTCAECALFSICWNIGPSICFDANNKFSRHFVEVDEDGNEIQQ